MHSAASASARKRFRITLEDSIAKCVVGTDADFAGVFFDVGDFRNASDVDQEFGRGQPQFHHRDQAMSAGEDFGALSMLLQEVDCFPRDAGTTYSKF